ncbi:MAG: radical SAM protein, partial [Nitrosopumilus sp.]
IELTNICNYRCAFCPSFTRKSGYMSPELLENILKNVNFKKNQLVHLHYHGESLLHPKLGKMISLCKQYGLTVGLSTNASLLNEQKSREIIESELDQLIIAFDGVSKEIYEKYRIGGNYEQVKENIQNFLKLKEKNNSQKPFTDLHVIKLTESLPLIDKFLSYWKTTPIDQITLKSYSTRGGQVKQNLAKTENWYYGKRNKRYPCMWFWSTVIILCDGRVVPCCHDMQGKIILGDLTKNTMQEIWNGKKIITLRKNEIAGNYEKKLCIDCNEWIGTPSGITGFIWNTLKKNFRKITRTSLAGEIFEVVYRKQQ